MKKISTLVAIFLVFSISVSACAPSQDITIVDQTFTSESPSQKQNLPAERTENPEESVSSGNAQNSMTTHINDAIAENIILDADVIKPQRPEVSLLQVDTIQFESDVIINTLFHGEEVSAENAGDGSSIIRSSQNGAVCNFYSTDFNDGLYYRTDFVEPLLYVVHHRNDDFQNNLNLFSTEEELSFLSRDDLTKEIDAVLKELKIDNAGNAVIYALDHQTITEEQERIVSLGEHSEYDFKDFWTAEDDCYLFTMDCIIDGIAVNRFDTLSLYEELTISASRIVGVYSKNGFEYIEIANLYNPTSSIKTADIIEVDVAIEVIKQKLGSLITSSTFTIENIELIYMPQFKDKNQAEKELTPVWCFKVLEEYISEKNNHLYQSYDYYMVDGYTGREI